MKLEHEIYDRVTVVSIAGEITADEMEPLRRLVEQRLAGDGRDFVLDMSQTHFVDSQGLETLLWLQDQANDRLGQVRLVNLTDTVHKILQITRMGHRFDSHADVESAVKSLR